MLILYLDMSFLTKKNEIVLENAPLPSDTLMFKKVINEISLRE